MSDTYFTIISNGSWDTECLKTFTDCCSSISSSSSSFFDCDSCTYSVSPTCIFKTDWLNAFNLVIYIKTSIFSDLFSFFDGSDSIAVKNFIDLVNSYDSNNAIFDFLLLDYCFLGSMIFTASATRPY